MNASIHAGMRRLARTVIRHSLRLEKGQRVLIDVTGQADAMVEALLEAARDAGAEAYLQQVPIRYLKQLILGSSTEQLKRLTALSLEQMSGMDAYIGIRSDDNVYELQDLPDARYEQYVKTYAQPKQAAMAGLPKWVLLRNPTSALAQLARMSDAAFFDIYERACTLNYLKWANRVRPLAALLEKAKHVRIVGPGPTDLQFSIQGMPAFVCDGRYNLPDGEIFTAPVPESVEGQIQFNVTTDYLGHLYDEVYMEFERGRVTKARCPQQEQLEQLEQLLQQDDGASRVGEFGIGLNPYVIRPMNNLLFDEKMQGSVHLALGQAYPMADNGNRSSLHLDFVLCQTEAFGGGELYLDGVLVRSNGRFTLPELSGMDNLPD
ncbi:aminopeptidase [Xylanibacillus composti]|uniref:Aminopeptidase n=1 Tax=Xylanibacillus composti TaxID=1572762 RepID=A0A8J4H4F8_9BACL|nr:aminopeptidase [Xylanibacillus composti]GIQ69327.1 aminopeptidase [Xylanibacillus composti]